MEPTVNNNPTGYAPTSESGVPSTPNNSFGAPPDPGSPGDVAGYGFEAPETDFTVISVDDDETISGTGADLRNEGGIIPDAHGGIPDDGDVCKSGETYNWDSYGVFATDRRPAPTILMRGANLLFPFSWPKTIDPNSKTGTVSDLAITTALGTQSALIENGGTPKGAATIQALSRAAERIDTMFNRSTPFSDFNWPSMLALLTSYHADLGRVALAFCSIASLLEYRKYALKAGLRLHSSWAVLADPA